MDALLERIERPEQAERAAAQRLEQVERAAVRRVRFWQRAAGILAAAGLLLVPLEASMAQGQPSLGNVLRHLFDLQRRLTALEGKTAALQATPAGTNFTGDVYVTSGNLYVQNGMGGTATTNGKGNLIVGYNENAPAFPRTGSHNVVVGIDHGWESYGGLMVGNQNRITAPFASVSGGQGNIASEAASSVGGGQGNIASGFGSWVSGGQGNAAGGFGSSVSGGQLNTASGDASSVSGGLSITQTNVEGWSGGSIGAVVSGSFRSP
jgi:hypothetical protein